MKNINKHQVGEHSRRLGRNALIYADTTYRYSVVRKALAGLEGSVLEVGGFSTGFHAKMVARWPQLPVTINCRFGHEKRPDIIASGVALPIRDFAFKQVVLIDVLEHVPTHDRAAIVREALRVAERNVLLFFPFSSQRNVAAERRLAAMLKRLGISEKEALAEHLQLGLPVIEDIVSHADPAIWKVSVRFLTDRPLLFFSMHLQAFIRHERFRKTVKGACSALLTASDYILPKRRAYRVLLSFTRTSPSAALTA